MITCSAEEIRLERFADPFHCPAAFGQAYNLFGKTGLVTHSLTLETNFLILLTSKQTQLQKQFSVKAVPDNNNVHLNSRVRANQGGR